ncbi:TIGR03084 family metal-binding protein [Streptomyces laculatispora]|uniref:TIGR03084 family metal-binding protein n=1 Tax=Streptomyces laculatispora TaxID=887464 RepID=A0ABY9IFB9_9ACTN|nr:TIGR03084 family metal-binding protein [Streptomyces laculatispora]WLQ45570.1 TIGR03084 family metal-binding protein [Streptomyces laculatispora]
MQDVYDDLALEGTELADLVAGLTPGEWAAATPATSWTVRHQVAHLAYVSRLVRLAVSDAGAFAAGAAPLREDFRSGMDARLAEYVAEPVPALLRRWAEERAAAEKGLAALKRRDLVPWPAEPLPASVLAAVALTELFAHGQDIRDGLGRPRALTDRIGHIVFLGTRTRDLAYRTRGLRPPAEPFRFELTAPSGDLWAFGPPDAGQRIAGPARDFCLLVTRRRHRGDLALSAFGTEADQWLDIAQTYVGPPGGGRAPQ